MLFPRLGVGVSSSSRGLVRLQSSSLADVRLSGRRVGGAITIGRRNFVVDAVDFDIGVDAFRRTAWRLERPLHLKKYHQLGAVIPWFQPEEPESPVGRFRHRKSAFKGEFGKKDGAVVSYEYMVPPPPPKDSGKKWILEEFLDWLPTQGVRFSINFAVSTTELIMQKYMAKPDPWDGKPQFQTFDAAAGLILGADMFNRRDNMKSELITNLYIAQTNIDAISMAAFRNLRVPSLVGSTDKGQIYGHSIWIGIQPVYTPFHRDPNPNLLCQIFGNKQIRIAAPGDGLDLYEYISRSMPSSNSRFRTVEMMDGPERELLHKAVWDKDISSGQIKAADVTLEAGDALFIPRGWWHSVRSEGRVGMLNGSVNWWFR
ncbi:Clavaminate synthase-like protein [Durotheca rogersii]|uniref:Clavaminate synthase-like protein n=1 Tax=Durotheca rogersii TaxID=419775 RepID=UPI00221F20BB|nr:Clavaminate synthase-like protein [Durotheca rogersii]KAI5866286.1 Clavaminate synthase-like protein [Durotheca rogersii]